MYNYVIKLKYSVLQWLSSEFFQRSATEMCNRDFTLPEEWGEGCQERPFKGTELGNGVVVGGVRS